jgi:hypothetical protein
MAIFQDFRTKARRRLVARPPGGGSARDSPTKLIRRGSATTGLVPAAARISIVERPLLGSRLFFDRLSSSCSRQSIGTGPLTKLKVTYILRTRVTTPE